jgi:hypothetical protein
MIRRKPSHIPQPRQSYVEKSLRNDSAMGKRRMFGGPFAASFRRMSDVRCLQHNQTNPWRSECRNDEGTFRKAKDVTAVQIGINPKTQSPALSVTILPPYFLARLNTCPVIPASATVPPTINGPSAVNAIPRVSARASSSLSAIVSQ